MFSRHPAKKLLAIYLGGVIGALIRVGLTEVFPHAPEAWPWPTFAVNIAGAFLIGYFLTVISEPLEGQLHHPFLVTGVCGTLTTFSAMQLELFNMVDSGELGLAAGYLAASLSIGYLAVRAGILAASRKTEVFR